MYSSEVNKESFNTLKYDMSLSDFVALEEFIAIQYSYQDESFTEAKKEAETAKRGFR